MRMLSPLSIREMRCPVGFFTESFVQQVRSIATYRANLWFSLAAEAIPLLGLVLYLGGVFPAHEVLYGYTRADMLTYYVAGLVLTAWIPTVWWEVGENIRSGALNTYLLRPKSYFWYFWTCQFAVNVWYTSMSLVFAGVLALIFPGSLQPPASLFHGAMFPFTALMAFQLAYQTGYLIYLSAFWIEDVSGLLSVTYLVQTVACGQLFPLDFLPSWASKVASFLPFPYWFFFPLKVYMGLPFDQVLQGIGIAAGWIVLTGVGIKLVWIAGLRRYDARGG